MSRWKDWPSGVVTSPPEASDNLLIYGDNLPAMEALHASHHGQVQSVYLDPPYNTGTAFEHYEDALSHEGWLQMMEARLRAIQPLLAPTGFIGVQIDDREQAYLQMLMDRIFGRRQRVATIVVKMSELSGVKMSHVHKRLPKLKEYILLYAASDEAKLNPLRVPKDDAQLDSYLRYYTKVIEDMSLPVEAWSIVPIRDYLQARGKAADAEAIRAFKIREAHRVVYRTNNAFLTALDFPTKTARVHSPTGVEYIWWEGKQMLFLADYRETYLGDLWTDISTINLNKEGGQAFRFSKKPEALIMRFFSLTSAPGDLVLDAFGGSGTTAAVAEQLQRRWVMMEEGHHLETHILPRLQAADAKFRVLTVA